MSKGLEKLLKERIAERNEVIKKLYDIIDPLKGRLGKITVILYGSYARGDFNLWSDIDIIVISEHFNKIKPLDRINKILDILPPNVEAICLTPQEARNFFKKPWGYKILKEAQIIIDENKIIEK